MKVESWQGINGKLVHDEQKAIVVDNVPYLLFYTGRTWPHCDDNSKRGRRKYRCYLG